MRSGLSSIHTTTSSTTTTQEEAVAQIEGLSRRIRSTARIFSSTTNQPTLSNWWSLRLFFQPLVPTWLKVRDLTTSSAKEISFLIATVPKKCCFVAKLHVRTFKGRYLQHMIEKTIKHLTLNFLSLPRLVNLTLLL